VRDINLKFSFSCYHLVNWPISESTKENRRVALLHAHIHTFIRHKHQHVYLTGFSTVTLEFKAHAPS